MFKPKRKITIKEENFVFFCVLCGTWIMAGRKTSSSSMWISSFSSTLKGMFLVIIWQRKFGGVPLPLGLSPYPLFSLPTWKEEENATTATINSSWWFVFLMYLKLHPPKHIKLHPCEKNHSMNTCHLHIGQWMNQNFIPKSKSCIDA